MGTNKISQQALIKHKAEQEQINHNNILQALVRIKNGTTVNIQMKPLGKVTVHQLARESCVSRASLYGNHKSFLSELEKINVKRSIGVTEKRKDRERKAESDRELIKKLIAAKEMLAQENYRLNEENKKLKRHLEALISQLGSKTNIKGIK